jgi:hypothetical protein
MFHFLGFPCLLCDCGLCLEWREMTRFLNISGEVAKPRRTGYMIRWEAHD